jgi:hypothetical protein
MTFKMRNYQVQEQKYYNEHSYGVVFNFMDGQNGKSVVPTREPRVGTTDFDVFLFRCLFNDGSSGEIYLVYKCFTEKSPT